MTMRSSVLSSSLFYFILQLLVEHGSAQSSAFQWGFTDGAENSIAACSSKGISIQNIGTVTPQAPYFIMAYEAGGISTSTFVGTDPNKLSWTVNHAPGTQLILGMVDANGNSGGVGQNVFTVTGSDSSCLPKSTSPAITVNNNASSSATLNTCDAVQFSISGGQKPYVVTVAETNNPVTFNTTMGDNDDTFLWVDNLSPGQKLIVAISDAAESYGKATSIFTLSGSSNTRCSIQSRSFNSASKDGSGDDNSSGGGSGNNKTSHTGIIIGVVVAVALIALMGMIAYFLLAKRRRERRQPEKSWAIDENDHRAQSIDGVEHRPLGQGDLTPFVLPPAPPAPYPGRTPTQSQWDARSRNTASMIGEEMLNGRESTYYMSDDGRTTPTTAHGLLGPSPSSNNGDPFATMNAKINRYRDDAYSYQGPTGSSIPPNSPHYRQQSVGDSEYLIAPGSASNYGSSRSRGTGPSRFRALNPDANEGDDFDPWASTRDEKHPEGPSGSSELGGSSSSGPSRIVYQHQDAGSTPHHPEVEEIPPAYPGFEGQASGAR